MKKAIPLIITSAALSLLFTAYLYVNIFPDGLYRYVSSHDNVTLRSVEPINPRLFTLLDSARFLIQRSPLYDSSISYRLYFCENFSRYTLFSCGRFSSFAITFPLANRIYVAKTDVFRDSCFANKPRNNRRSLHSILAHEMTHCLLSNKFGLWRTMLASKWKTEGYCEFIANEGSFDPQTGLQLIKQGKNNRSVSFSYFKYRLYVTYLMTREQLSIEEIMNTRFNMKTLDAKIRAAADSILEMPR